MTFQSSFQKPFAKAFPQESEVVADGWWLSGGISAGDCVAAYQPKGAASLAASYINLANPGTFDAIDDGGDATPEWSAIKGWFGGTSEQGKRYLRTTIQPANDQSWSAIVFGKITVPDSFASFFGSVNTAGSDQRFNIGINTGPNYVQYSNGAITNFVPKIETAAVLAFGGNKAYRNGVEEVGTLNVGDVGQSMINLNAYGRNLDGIYHGYDCEEYALAIYNITITQEEVTALTIAMSAL